MEDLETILAWTHGGQIYLRHIDDLMAKEGKARMTPEQRELLGRKIKELIKELMEGKKGQRAEEPSTRELLNRLVELTHTVQDLSKLIAEKKDSNSDHLSRLTDLRRRQTTVVKNVRTGKLQNLRTYEELSRRVEKSKVQILKQNAIHFKQMAAAQKKNDEAYKNIFESQELLSEQCAALANQKSSNDTRGKNQVVSAALIGFVTGACIAGAANRVNRKMKLSSSLNFV